jgi:hypothetical protein
MRTIAGLFVGLFLLMAAVLAIVITAIVHALIQLLPVLLVVAVVLVVLHLVGARPGAHIAAPSPIRPALPPPASSRTRQQPRGYGSTCQQPPWGPSPQPVWVLVPAAWLVPAQQRHYHRDVIDAEVIREDGHD